MIFPNPTEIVPFSSSAVINIDKDQNNFKLVMANQRVLVPYSPNRFLFVASCFYRVERKKQTGP